MKNEEIMKNVTVVGSQPNVRVFKLPPKITKPKPKCIKTAFRQKKSEVVAELLFMLWDKDPHTYDLGKVIKDKFIKAMAPLKEEGLEKERIERDMWMMSNS